MRKWTALIAVLMLAFFCGAAAQEKDMEVYVSPGCLTEDAALALVQLLSQAYGQVEFTCSGDESGTLWQRVMDGDGPHLAICTAQEAARYAKEGLLLPLDVDAQEAERIAKEVLSACMQEDERFMAPLYARHRRMAVNQRKMEELQIAALMDERVFPVWQPMQLYQVLEEAALAGAPAMELWPCSGEDGDAPLAFMQALYGGEIVQRSSVQADNDAAVLALEWMQELVEADYIGIAESRAQALKNFLDGKTVLFIDWTDEDARAYARLGADKEELVSRPYPSSTGLPVRDMQVIGVAAFETGDEETDALLGQAAAFLAQDEQAKRLIVERGIYDDGGLWLSFPGAGGGGSALCALMGEAVDAALTGKMSAQAALRLAQAGYKGGL